MNIFKWKKSKEADKSVKTEKTVAPSKTATSTKANVSSTEPAVKSKTATGAKKKANAKSSDKQPTNTYYLTTRVESGKKVGWEIKRGNAAKVSAVVPTKEAAKAKVKELAKNSKATVIIYKMDGSIEETYKINE